MRRSHGYLPAITFGLLTVGAATTAMSGTHTQDIEVGETKEWEITNPGVACKSVTITIAPSSGYSPNQLECAFFVLHDDETPTYAEYQEFADSCSFRYLTYNNDEASSSTQIRSVLARVYNSSYPSEAEKKTLEFNLEWGSCS